MVSSLNDSEFTNQLENILKSTYSFLGMPSGTITVESDEGIEVRCVNLE